MIALAAWCAAASALATLAVLVASLALHGYWRGRRSDGDELGRKRRIAAVLLPALLEAIPGSHVISLTGARFVQRPPRGVQ